MCITCWLVPVEAGELWIPRTGLTGACEPYDVGAGKANLEPLQKQQMLLTPESRLKTGFLYQCLRIRVFLGPHLVGKALGFRKYFFLSLYPGQKLLWLEDWNVIPIDLLRGFCFVLFYFWHCKIGTTIIFILNVALIHLNRNILKEASIILTEFLVSIELNILTLWQNFLVFETGSHYGAQTVIKLIILLPDMTTIPISKLLFKIQVGRGNHGPREINLMVRSKK